MKNLYLIRHAKSDWNTKFEADHDRPISEKGKKKTLQLVEFLRQKKYKFELAYISDSKRTKETFQILKENGISFENHFFTHELYEVNFSDALEFVSDRNPPTDSLLLVGHNFCLEYLAEYLLKGNPGSLFYKFPTSAFIHIVMDIKNWNEMAEGIGCLRIFWIP